MKVAPHDSGEVSAKASYTPASVEGADIEGDNETGIVTPGGFGNGVKMFSDDDKETAEVGHEKIASFPLDGPFWTRDPEHGQA